MQNVVKKRNERACCFSINSDTIANAPSFFAVSALAPHIPKIYSMHCFSHIGRGVVSEKEFHFQPLYLLPLLEHPLIVEEAACKCQLVDG